jgi:hypothetical protein
LSPPLWWCRGGGTYGVPSDLKIVTVVPLATWDPPWGSV